MDHIDRFAQRITRLERNQRAAASTPQLGTSSIEDGTILERDADGNLVGAFGTQVDGTHVAASFNGPIPPTPSTPSVEVLPGSVRTSWDGSWVDGAVSPMDLVRIDVHFVDAPETDPLTTPPASSITSQGWGDTTVPLPIGVHYAVLVAWTQSGKWASSAPSASFEILPISVDLTELEEALDALTADLAANAAALATAQADLDAAEALIATNTSNIASAQSALDIAEAAIIALDGDMAANAAAISAANLAIDAAEALIASNTSAISAAQADVDNLIDTVIPGLNSDLSGLTSDLADLSTALGTAQGDIAALDTAMTTLTGTTLPDLQAELDAAEADVATIEGLFPIVSTSIADGAITTPKMTANSINGDRISAGTLAAAKIVADSITANEIAANAITATEIAADAVTAVKILAGAITTAKLDAGAVTAAKILANTITANEIATGAITADEIAADAVTAVKILAGAITTAKLDAGAVTAAKIAANTITAGQIAADTITAGQIAANAITTTELDALAVTAAKIAANTITAGQIAADTITAAQIATDAITANEIAANAVTTAELNAAAVTAAKIATHTITALQIAAGTITAAEIAAGTITANEIAAGTITAEEIAAGAITATELAAGSVTADELASIITLSSLFRTSETGQRVEFDADGIRIYDAAGAQTIGVTFGDSFFSGRVSASLLETGQATLGGQTLGAPGGAFVLGGTGVDKPLQQLQHVSVPAERFALAAVNPAISASPSAYTDSAGAKLWRGAAILSIGPRPASLLVETNNYDGSSAEAATISPGLVSLAAPDFKVHSIGMSATWFYLLRKDLATGDIILSRRAAGAPSALAALASSETAPIVTAAGFIGDEPVMTVQPDTGDVFLAWRCNGAQTLNGLSFANKEIAIQRFTASAAGSVLTLSRTQTIKTNQVATAPINSINVSASSTMFDLAGVAGCTGLYIQGDAIGAFSVGSMILPVPNVISGSSVTVTATATGAYFWYDSTNHRGGVWNGTDFWGLEQDGVTVRKYVNSAVNQASPMYHGYTYWNGTQETRLSPLLDKAIFARYQSKWTIPPLPAGITQVRLYEGLALFTNRFERVGTFSGTAGQSLLIQQNPIQPPAGTATNQAPSTSNFTLGGAVYELNSNTPGIRLKGSGDGNIGPLSFTPTSLSAASTKINLVGTPSSTYDAANKFYVDNIEAAKMLFGRSQDTGTNVTTAGGGSTLAGFGNSLYADACFTYSAGSWTCDVAGTYLINAQISYPVNTTGTRAAWIVKTVSGSPTIIGQQTQVANATLTSVVQVQALDRLAVGDVLTLVGYQTSGVTLTTSTGTTRMVMHRQSA